MKPFSVTADSAHTPAEAWARITDWPTHGQFVPLTRITVTPPGPSAVGTVFTARTAVGRLGFDDPMEIVCWQPPGEDGHGSCRLEKRGKVMLGWAEITVEPSGAGSRTTWTEAARPKGLPRVAEPVANAVAKLLFGRVLRQLILGGRR